VAFRKGKTDKKLMAWFDEKKERQRFYLLPGMGGRALKRKHKRILGWSIVAGLAVSLAFAALLWFIYSRPTPF
jgi:hypothetical protein